MRAGPEPKPGPHSSDEQRLWHAGKRYGLCMPGIMDALPETSQHEDVMAHTAHELTALIERVRQARQLLQEASDRLTLTRQAVEKDERIERVRRACEHLDGANQQLAQTRQQAEEDQYPSAAGPTADG